MEMEVERFVSRGSGTWYLMCSAIPCQTIQVLSLVSTRALCIPNIIPRTCSNVTLHFAMIVELLLPLQDLKCYLIVSPAIMLVSSGADINVAAYTVEI